MRPARVTDTTDLSKSFRLINFQDEALKACSWSPGDKVQVKLDGGFITRTYTPISWDRDEGKTQFLAYCHGTGPGSEWAKHVAVGDERQFFGPRGSLSLDNLAPSAVLFGDETSFALALAVEQTTDPTFERHYLFEVNDRSEASEILDRLGLPPRVLVERQAHDRHLPEIADTVLDRMRPASTCLLSGKASSIQHVSRTLKQHGIEARRLRTKAYWASGKVGLD